LAVPMSMPLNTKAESTLIISPLSTWASCTDRAVFPDAVGPIKKIAGGLDLCCMFFGEV